MGEADEVGVHVFEIAEDGRDILIGVPAASADGRFSVHVGTLQEDGFAVEQDAGAVDADVAEADVVGEFVRSGAEGDFIELRGSGRPEGELVGCDVKGGAPVGSGLDGSIDAGLRDAEGDGGAGGCIHDVDVAGELLGVLEGWAVLEVDVVVVDEGGWDGYEREVAGKTAVVHPVDAHGWDAIEEAGCVYGDDDEVGAGVQNRAGFAVEGGVAALVIADAFAVDPDMGAI